MITEVTLFRATADLVLPTTVTGSWPRPSWFQAALKGRTFSTGLNDLTFREQFLDALQVVVGDQERAGLDILSNGDYHQDPDLAGRSWMMYPLERIGGFARDNLDVPANQGEYTGKSILGEIFGDWRYPPVLTRVSEGLPLEYGRIWQAAQDRATRPVKMGVVSAQPVSNISVLRTDAYPDRRELLWDLAGIMNAELRRLAAAGCAVIQVEEPSIHWRAADGDDKGYVNFLVDCLNREVEGLDGVEVWAHTCWGNPAMQRSHENTDYGACLELFMEHANVDVWTIESKDRGHSPLPLFERYKGGFPAKKVAVGMVSHRTVQVESVDEIARDIRYALHYIPAENLILSSDCGFGRQGLSRLVAYHKAAALAQAAAAVRDDLS